MTETVNLTITGTAAEVLAAAAKFAGGGVSPVPGPTPAPAPTPTPVNAFPADPATAPFPSPENSTSIVLNGKVSGAPYLRSSAGAIYQFALDAGGNPVPAGTGWQININGQPVMSAATPAAPMACFQMIERQGGVYFQTPNALGWGHAKADSPNGWSIVALPPVSGTAPVVPVMPAGPVPTSPAPGASGTVILAGPSQTIKTLAAAVAAAKAGDTIRLDPGAVFAESVQLTVPLLIDGQGTVANPGSVNASFSGGAIVDGSSFTAYALGKGGLVVATDCVFRGLEIRGFGLQEAATGGTSGVRTSGSAGANVTIDNCYIHDNQDGVCSGAGGPENWAITNCLFADNGIGDGLSHNIYIGNEGVHLTLSGVTSIVRPQVATASGAPFARVSGQAYGGHALKTRAHALAISGTNYFAAADASPIDIPDGTTQPFTVAAGTTLVKNAADANHSVLDYAVESQVNGTVGGSVACTINAACANPFVAIGAGVVDFTGASFVGTKPTNSGSGTASGL